MYNLFFVYNQVIFFFQCKKLFQTCQIYANVTKKQNQKTSISGKI